MNKNESHISYNQHLPLLVIIGGQEAAQIKKLAHAFRKNGMFSEYFPNFTSFQNSEQLEGNTSSKVFLFEEELWNKLEVEAPLFLEQNYCGLFFERNNLASFQQDIVPIFAPIFLQENQLQECVEKFIKQLLFLQRREKQTLILHQQIKNYREKVSFLEKEMNLKELKKIGEEQIGRIEEQILQIDPVQNFLEQFTKILEHWKDLTAYTLIIWEEEKEKMLSPQIKSTKFRPLDDLWDRPIQTEAQHQLISNLATEKALTILGPHFIPLEILGPHKFPTILAFFLFENDQIYSPESWRQIETSANYILSKNYLEKERDQQLFNKINITPFDFFNRLQRFYAHSTTQEQDRPLYYLDFSSLFKAVAQNDNSFKWSSFYDGFLQGLLIKSNTSFKICTIGIQHWFFITTSSQEVEFLKTIKNYALEFPYWQYFEDSQKALLMNLTPKIYGISLQRLMNEKNILDIFLQKASTVFQTHSNKTTSSSAQNNLKF